MKNIILIGGGGHCKSVIDVIESGGIYTIAGIVDKKELIGDKILGYEVIGCDDELVTLHKRYRYALITIGQIKTAQRRIELFKKCKKIGFILPTIISPLSHISRYASVDEGSVVLHHCVINSNSKIGKNCIINTKVLCEHDSVVEDNCHISTGVIINGGSVVRANTFIGSGSIVVENRVVSEFIKAGSIYK